MRSGDSRYDDRADRMFADGSAGGVSLTSLYGVRPAAHISLPRLDNLSRYNINCNSNNAEHGTVHSTAQNVIFLGNDVTFTASPNPGYLFDYWMINGTRYENNPFTYFVNRDTNATAYFKSGVIINVMSSDINQGIVSGGGTYEYGSTISIMALPQSNWNFSHWLSSTGALYDENPLIIPVETNATYTAYFKRNYVTITTSNAGAEISSTLIDTTSTTITHNLTFTTGNYISGITVNNGVEYPVNAINGTLAVNDNSCTAIDFRTNPAGSMLYLAVYGAMAEVTITLHFVNIEQSYTPASGGANIEGVALQVSGGEGSNLAAVGEARITGYTTTNNLTTVHVSAVASSGYYFVGWETSDGTDLSTYGSTADILYSLVEGKILTAVFAPNPSNSQTNGSTDNTSGEFS